MPFPKHNSETLLCHETISITIVQYYKKPYINKCDLTIWGATIENNDFLS